MIKERMTLTIEDRYAVFFTTDDGLVYELASRDYMREKIVIRDLVVARALLGEAIAQVSARIAELRGDAL